MDRYTGGCPTLEISKAVMALPMFIKHGTREQLQAFFTHFPLKNFTDNEMMYLAFKGDWKHFIQREDGKGIFEELLIQFYQAKDKACYLLERSYLVPEIYTLPDSTINYYIEKLGNFIKTLDPNFVPVYFNLAMMGATAHSRKRLKVFFRMAALVSPTLEQCPEGPIFSKALICAVLYALEHDNITEKVLAETLPILNSRIFSDLGAIGHDFLMARGAAYLIYTRKESLYELWRGLTTTLYCNSIRIQSSTLLMTLNACTDDKERDIYFDLCQCYFGSTWSEEEVINVALSEDKKGFQVDDSVFRYLHQRV
jgi:hypothetical protein